MPSSQRRSRSRSPAEKPRGDSASRERDTSMQDLSKKLTEEEVSLLLQVSTWPASLKCLVPAMSRSASVVYGSACTACKIDVAWLYASFLACSSFLSLSCSTRRLALFGYRPTSSSPHNDLVCNHIDCITYFSTPPPKESSTCLVPNVGAVAGRLLKIIGVMVHLGSVTLVCKTYPRS